MKVLVAGGTGFVGSRLSKALVTAGHTVRVMSRSPGPDDFGGDGVENVRGDVGDPASLAGPLDGIDVAYYLIHSLQRSDFVEYDAAGARAFGQQAAKSGVTRIVYLGGLGDEHDELSDHLRSRRQVEQILSGLVPTVALRAGIVIGEGSLSWEILYQLVTRLPLMVTPRWVQTRTQPIAVDDAVDALAAAAAPAIEPGAYEVGVPEPTTYADMLKAVAEHTGRRLVIVPVPVLSPRLSSWWLRLVTDVDLTTARALVDSMTTDAIVTDDGFSRLVGRAPHSFDEAITDALAERGRKPSS